MNKDFLEAITALCKEKGISEEIIIDALEGGLVSAYKKNFNNAQNVEVDINTEKGAIKVYAKKRVVEEVSNDAEEISLEDAQKLKKKSKLDDEIKIEVTPKNFARVAATNAKQIITQRIREAEKGIIFSEFTEKTGQIVAGRIERIERGNVYVDIGKIEAYLPVNEQPIGEEYRVGDMIKCYVSDVRNGIKGTSILVSRTHPGLVRKLFETEVPEIADGIVEIKNIAREAGSRTKIAVYSTDPDIDAQGACIGPKGLRVQNIGDELRDEKIDIVKWSEDPAEYIAASLSPAKVLSTVINEEDSSAKVTVPEYQLSLAIGKSGQNVRLAARLTGWKIDISAE